jgi:hypothetical protein
MDVLEFKGIWKGRVPKTVLAKLRDLNRIAKTNAEAAQKYFNDKIDPTMKVQVVMLSDTIVIGVSTEPSALPQSEREANTIFCASAAASEVIRAAASAPEPTLTLRGVIAVDDFLMNEENEKERFVIGPAVDEVAELERMAEAAIVWMAPTALKAWRITRRTTDQLCFLSHKVPLKGGGVYDTAAVNPYYWLQGDRGEERRQLRDSMISRFNESRLDIQIKMQNTDEFLRAAELATQRLG